MLVLAAVRLGQLLMVEPQSPYIALEAVEAEYSPVRAVQPGQLRAFQVLLLVALVVALMLLVVVLAGAAAAAAEVDGVLQVAAAVLAADSRAARL